MSDSGRENDTAGFTIPSELFPAFRKSAALSERASNAPDAYTLFASPYLREKTVALYPEDDSVSAQPEDDTANQPYQSEDREPSERMGGNTPSEAESEAERLLSGKKPEPAIKKPKGEYIPALFGGVSLEKLREQEAQKAKEEELNRQPTLLEFLSQPVDRGELLPVPSLFEGIGSEYYSSGYVLKLAEEEEEEERARLAATEPDEPPEPEPEPEPIEPAPAPEELFDMISDISRQQEEDWLRHRQSLTEDKRKKSDPYNTAFNNREVVINYDNIGELPMERGYGFSEVTKEEQAAYDLRAGRKPSRGDPDLSLKFKKRQRSERRRVPGQG